MRRHVEIREATPADTERIRTVHRDAVTELASADYSREQIAAWTEPIESADYAAVESADPHWVVAESSDRVVGFGSLRRSAPDGYEAPVDGEVTGVYVHPSVARQGVGSRILAALEREALDAGLRRLGLEASTNALPFYERHGYERVRDLTHEFGGDVEGPAVEMHKRL